MRVLWGPLILSHVLLLGGAILVVLGFVDGTLWLEAVGSIMVVSGIIAEASIIVWSARLVRRTAQATSFDGAPSEISAASSPASRCIRCGWVGGANRATCPRCGGSLVPATPLPRPPA